MKIHDTLHWRLEAAFYLSAIAADEHPTKRMREQMQRHPEYGAEIEAMYPGSIAVYDHIAAQIDAEDQDLQLLFREMPAFDHAPWMLYARQIQGKAGTRLDGFADMIDEMEMQDIPRDDAALLAWLDRAPLDYDTRAKLLFLHRHYDDFEGRVLTLCDRAEALLREVVWRIDDEIQQAVQGIHEAIQAEGLASMLRAYNIPVTLEPDVDYDVYPHTTFINALRLTEDSLFIGTHFLTLNTLLNQRDFAPERLQEVLRTLGDRTKFDILRLLGEETLFGGALAARLGLTPATISHHISQLTTLNLVHIVKDGTRVYYHANKENVSAYLQAAKNVLGE